MPGLRLLIALLVLCVGVFIGVRQYQTRWVGLKSDVENLRPVGHFRSLESCKTEIEKVGGYWQKPARRSRRATLDAVR
jgi:hypothetical protein